MKRGRHESGAILVAVLWSIALLSALAMAASTTFRSFAGVVTVHRDRLRADALLTAGLEVAAGVIARLNETPLRDIESRVALPGGSVQFRLGDEGGRIDLGKAPVELLASALRSVGARDADGIAQRVVAWRTPEGMDPLNPAPMPQLDSPFSDVRQLANVPGVAPEVAAAVAPLLTVFGNASVNPATAPAEVVAALPGMDGSRLRAFLETRRRFPSDAARLETLLGPARKHLATGPQRVASVRLTATLEDGFAANAEAVIVVLPDDGEPYRILAWNPLGSGREAGSNNSQARTAK
jgi:general secretion pathway protein K